MAKKISISFKEKEAELLKYVESKLNASYYIKTLILEDMKRNKTTKKTKAINTAGNNDDLFDF
ncbi:hypothetical protein AB2T63_12115 [Clostridium butyricum]|uniref:Uncharacterized protein n=1 Tax=Clostridium butyricum TaxID=1492 RepID=A0A2S7FCP0_CLOBU|nr:hypothetical protein [Clostridium butyricum]KHD14958.1 hypothetical protein OA81_12720 [Clostridium butyricum]PPV16022.1 hypothetical protein AWN73_10750 [Clostridium butyricum]